MSRLCPYLQYRREGDGQSFDHERPFCGVVESFVQPMRADICTGRHGLDHTAHCEYYRDHEGIGPLESLGSDEAPSQPSDAASDDGGADSR